MIGRTERAFSLTRGRTSPGAPRHGDRDRPDGEQRVPVAVVELPTGEVSVAAGPLVPGDVSEDVRALLEVARRILPGAMKIECVGDDTAFALVDLNAIDRAPSCTLFVGNVLVGRYAALKFRSDVGRLFSAIAANDIQPGGSLDGKD